MPVLWFLRLGAAVEDAGSALFCDKFDAHDGGDGVAVGADGGGGDFDGADLLGTEGVDEDGDVPAAAFGGFVASLILFDCRNVGITNNEHNEDYA